MGAGGSTQGAGAVRAVTQLAGGAAPKAPSVYKLCVIERQLMPGQTLEKGIGGVTDASELRTQDTLPPSPQEMSPGYTYGWFVESTDMLGSWEPYNEESSERLERAYLEQKGTCLVTVKMHAYTVDLAAKQQLPPAGGKAGAVSQLKPRAVKRAPVETYTDTATGEIKRREVVRKMMDPFRDDANPSDAENADADAGPAQPAEGANSNAPRGPSGARTIATYTSKYPLLVRTVVPHSKAIFTMALTPSEAGTASTMLPNGRGEPMVLTSGRDGILSEWNLNNNTSTTIYAPSVPGACTVLTAQYSFTGKYVIVGSDNKLATLYRAGSAQPLQTLRGHVHKVYGACICAGDKQVITGAMDGFVRTWDIETGACDRSERCHDSHIFSVVVSRNLPHTALSAGDDALLLMHDFRSPHSVVLRFAGHTRTLWDCDLRSDEMQFSSTGMDNTVRLWDPRSSVSATHVLSHHTRPVHCARFMPAGKGILSSSKDGRVFLYNTTSGNAVWRAKAHGSSVFRALYNVETKMLLTCSADTSVNVWEWKGGDMW